MTPILKELPYHEDSASLMLRLARLPDPVFLDSSMNQDRGARFDILTAAPSICVEMREGQICRSFSGSDVVEILPMDIFAAVKTTLAQFKSATTDFDNLLSELPFVGGAAGYFAYNCHNPAESVAQVPAGRATTPSARIGVYHWAIIIDHQLHRTTFFIRPECPPELARLILATVESEAPTETVESFRLMEPFQSNLNPAQYKQAFDRLKAYIQAGDCYQANLAQRFQSRHTGSPLLAYLQLRQRSRSPFSAYLGLPTGAVLCLSPERFLQVQQRKVLTQPIKGTRKRGHNATSDEALRLALVSSEKDRAENLMIVDLLRNDLGSLCKTGSVKTDKLFELQSFNSVHHLVSIISAELPAQHSPLDLLRNCFPGGSITGAPKIRAMEIIAELELSPRQVYCGVIGYIGFDEHMDTNIVIRTLLCEQEVNAAEGDIYCWGGGGIVADSVCEQEYDEGCDKVRLLLSTLESLV